MTDGFPSLKEEYRHYTRMLVSHNFDITDPAIPVLSPGNFTEIFLMALEVNDSVGFCQRIDNPHWIFELRFDGNRFTAQQIGDRLVKALAEARKSKVAADVIRPHTLALGGLKQTPATVVSRNSLQPNEWGVDVVETVDADAFLAGLNWEATIASKDPATVFQSILK